MRDAVRIPMYGCDCYAYGLLAAGHADLVIEADLKVYDYMALIPVIQVRPLPRRGQAAACIHNNLRCQQVQLITEHAYHLGCLLMPMAMQHCNMTATTLAYW